MQQICDPWLSLRCLPLWERGGADRCLNTVQYAAEMHIVAAVSKGAGRPEWGCDAFWEDGQMDLSKLKADTCGTVFSVPFTLNASALAPTWLQKLLDTYTSRAGSSTPITGLFSFHRRQYVAGMRLNLRSLPADCDVLTPSLQHPICSAPCNAYACSPELPHSVLHAGTQCACLSQSLTSQRFMNDQTRATVAHAALLCLQGTWI